ncbi:hypothetical protein IWX50DRAFT_625294 [Phyllosticta citricarpa]
MTALVVNGQTTQLGNATVPTSSSTGLGAVIIGGLTGPDSPTTTRAAAVSTPTTTFSAAAPAIVSSSAMTLLGFMGAFALAFA